MKKKKVLIIGSSKTIKLIMQSLFNKKFKLYFKNFRNVWLSKNNSQKFEYIVLSGFHYKICTMNNNKLNNYIREYYNFIKKLEKQCKNLILITTYLHLDYSFCRVVFFYYNLVTKFKLLEIKKLSIYNFRKALNMTLLNKCLKKILIKFNFKNIDEIHKNIKNYQFTKIKKINFYLIKIPRPRMVDRLLRLI